MSSSLSFQLHPLHRSRISKRWAQPKIVIVRTENYGHAVVNVGQERIWSGSQDRAALDHLPLRVLPSVPETGEREQLSAVHLETIRLFRLAVFLPLIEPVRWDEAPLRLERFPK